MVLSGIKSSYNLCQIFCSLWCLNNCFIYVKIQLNEILCLHHLVSSSACKLVYLGKNKKWQGPALEPRSIKFVTKIKKSFTLKIYNVGGLVYCHKKGVACFQKQNIDFHTRSFKNFLLLLLALVREWRDPLGSLGYLGPYEDFGPPSFNNRKFHTEYAQFILRQIEVKQLNF